MSGIDILNSLNDRGVDFGSSISVTAAAMLDVSALGKIVVCSGTSADYTVGLPVASESKGKRIVFVMSSALTKMVTLDGNASETIDGYATRVMWAGEVAELWSDGSQWVKVGGKSIPMAFSAYASADITGIAHNTWTQVLLNTVPVNIGGAFNSNAFTVRRGGSYSLTVGTAISTDNPATQFFSRGVSVIYKNGSVYHRTNEQWPNGAASSLLVLNAPVLLALSSFDIITNWMYGTNNASAAFTQQGVTSGSIRTSFSGCEQLPW